MKKILILTIFALLNYNKVFSQSTDSTAIDSNVTSYGNPIANTVPSFNLEQIILPVNVSNYLEQKLTDYHVYNINFSALNAYINGNPYALELNLGTTFLSLQRRDIRSPNYTETESTQNGNTLTNYTQDLVNDSLYEVHMFKGFADHNNNKIVRLSIEANRLAGYIWNTETNQILYFTTVQDFISDNNDTININNNSLLVFDLTALKGIPNAGCIAIQKIQNAPEKTTGSFKNCAPRFLTIAAEGDYSWCQNYGINATSRILENLFFVEGVYSVNFNISFNVTNINLLRNSPTAYSTTDAVQRLYDFQNNWNLNHSSITRDIAILYSGNISGTLGVSFVSGLNCASNNTSYTTVCISPKLTLTCSHEIGHSFGSQHDDDSYDKYHNLIPGYHTSTCSGSDIPIMCSYAISNGPNYYFSSYTRNIILAYANTMSSCLSDYWSGTPVSKMIKTWSNWQNQRWIASWLMQNKDIQVTGNFDGADSDEEIFFASPDNKWVGIMDFSCDQGTDWYHMWGNSGNGRFGTWIRNSGDKYLSGDFDGNDKTDLISFSGSSYWAAIQEYNPSNWSWIHKWGNSGSGWISSWRINQNDKYVIGDFDGDGKDELFCVNPNGWAQLIKFYWVATGSGGYYNPQTIWNNYGSNNVGGLQISSIQLWLKGKMKTTSQDELFTIGNSFTSVLRFSGSGSSAGWTFITGEGITTNFNTPNTTPANINFRFMGTGNIDNDSYDEYVAINQQWIGTQDYSGGGLGMDHNWNNSGSSMLNDWNLNSDVDYLLVKAAQQSPKQIFGRKSEKRTSGWWLWSSSWWEPTLAALYRTNAATQNFRMTPKINNDLQGKLSTVYPNPTSGSVNILLDSEITSAEVVILDMVGKELARQTVTPINNTISLVNYPAGTYIIRTALPDNSILTSKIVIYEK